MNLIEAVNTGDIELVKLLIYQGDDVNQVDKIGYTPLMLAIGRGDIEMARVLLNIDCPLLYRGRDQKSIAILYAARNGHTGIVKLLIDKGACIHWIPLRVEPFKGCIVSDSIEWAYEDDEFTTPLIQAAAYGHIGVVQLLLDSEDDGTALNWAAKRRYVEIFKLLLNKKTGVYKEYHFEEALRYAAEGGHIEIVKLLLSRCGEVKNDVKRQALNAAAEGGHIETVKLLLDKGFDVNVVDENRSLLSAAARGGNSELVKLLLSRYCKVEDSAKFSALNRAAYCNHAEIVELFLDEIIDFNKITEYNSPLISAAEGNAIDVVKLLLDRGFNVDEAGDARTALINAAAEGHLKVVNLLIERGANVNHIDYAGYTSLIFAAMHGYTEIVELLLDKGADINKVGIEGGSALINSIKDPRWKDSTDVKRQVLKMSKLLLDKGANINQIDKRGNNALIYAAQNGYAKVVRLLLDKGADVDQANNNGDTALIEGVKFIKGGLEVIKILLDHGADYNKRNASGKKALEINYFPDIAKQFIIEGAFVPDDKKYIYKNIDRILLSSNSPEKVIVLANLISIVVQEDMELIQDALDFLKEEINNLYIDINTKNFRMREKINLCKEIQVLKTKTQVTVLTEEVLEGLWKKIDDELVAKLRVSYDKISDVWGHFISKGELNKDPAQKIANYFQTDDDLENLCKAVPYKYALQILKSISQKDAAVEIQVDESMAGGSAAVLGAEENTQELPV